MAGQALASVALCGLAGAPATGKSREALSKKLCLKLLESLRKREARRELGPKVQPVACTWLDCGVDDAEYVVNDVWRGRCAATRRKLDRKPLVLCRWWRSLRPPRPHGCAWPADAPPVGADALICLAPPLADARQF